MIIKKNKSRFFISSDFEIDANLDYEDGDCFDLDDECKPIPKVLKKKIFDKTRIMNYILFSIIITVFGYIIYTTINNLYK
jgi:hypothetical protein